MALLELLVWLAAAAAFLVKGMLAERASLPGITPLVVVVVLALPVVPAAAQPGGMVALDQRLRFQDHPSLLPVAVAVALRRRVRAALVAGALALLVQQPPPRELLIPEGAVAEPFLDQLVMVAAASSLFARSSAVALLV